MFCKILFVMPSYFYKHKPFWVPLSKSTLVFLYKEHVTFDQGLDFLDFSWGNQGENQEKP